MPKQSASKPLIEKRRRSRITQSLQEIRMMVDTSTTQQSIPYKLERAEVLELAVDHMNKLRTKPLTEPTAREMFTSGYVDCLHETLCLLSSEKYSEVRGKLSVFVADALERRLSRSVHEDLSDLQPPPINPLHVSQSFASGSLQPISNPTSGGNDDDDDKLKSNCINNRPLAAFSLPVMAAAANSGRNLNKGEVGSKRRERSAKTTSTSSTTTESTFMAKEAKRHKRACKDITNMERIGDERKVMEINYRETASSNQARKQLDFDLSKSKNFN